MDIKPIFRKADMTKHVKLTLYGEPMIGKTSFALTFPRPIIISTDGNTSHVQGTFGLLKINLAKTNFVTDKHGRQLQLDGWEMFCYTLDTLLAENADDYDTLIIDVIDTIYNMCRLHILNKKNLEHESVLKAYERQTLHNYINTCFEREMIKLENLQKNLIFISHIYKSEDGTVRASLRDTSWNAITRLVHLEIYMANFQVQNEPTLCLQIRANRLGLPIYELCDPDYEALSEHITSKGTVFETDINNENV